MASSLTSVIRDFVPTPRALASTFPRRIWRAHLWNLHRGEAGRSPKPIERLWPLPRDGYGKVGYLMHVKPAPSQTLGLDPTRTYLVRAPRTRHSSHQGNFTNPHFSFPVHDHSFIHSHAYIHTFIHTYIHSFIYPFIHPIYPSIAYAIDASQRFVSRHEAAVISFDMSGERLRFEGWPAKGSRPPHVEQSQGRKPR